LKPLKDVDSAERAQLIHALAWLLPALVVLGVFTAFAASAILGLGLFLSLLVGLSVILIGFSFFYVIMYKGVIGGTASLLGSIYGGAGSPAQRRPAYSRAQALASRGACDDALAVLEADIFEDPGDAGPYLAAAAICIDNLGDRQRGADFYRRALAAERLNAETGAYICVRLAQLHEAEGDTGRESVELRRLLERYPESLYCAQARRRLKELKRTASVDESTLPSD
jgi:hypothetical protein